MDMFLGLVAFASWIYSVVIIFKKVEKTTTFEKTVLITGLILFILYLIGTLSK